MDVQQAVSKVYYENTMIERPKQTSLVGKESIVAYLVVKMLNTIKNQRKQT